MQMGVGKTLELISLIANTPASERTGPTLIVCPLSTLGNWEDQLFQHCAEDTLTTYVRGSNNGNIAHINRNVGLPRTE